MRVEVYSDDGNLLFKVSVGSKRRCDGTNCYPAEVKEALKLARDHGELPKWYDFTARRFYARRQKDRMARA